MKNKITIEELEKYLWGSAVLLRTHVDAGAYKQYIFPLLKKEMTEWMLWLQLPPAKG